MSKLKRYASLATALASLRDGRISKTKLAALVSAVVGLAIAFGWVDFTADQREAVVLLAVSAIALFLRDGLDRPTIPDQAADVRRKED